jgi:hypothetical protein
MKNNFIMDDLHWKSQACIMPKDGVEIENIYKCYCKRNVLTEPCGSAEHGLHTTGIIPFLPL